MSAGEAPANREILAIREEDEKDVDGAIRRIVLSGSVDQTTSRKFEQAVQAVLARGPGRPRAIVDMTAVTYVSSAGWGVLIGHIKEFRSRNGDVRVAGIRPSVRGAFDLLGLRDYFQTFDDWQKARDKPW